MKTLLASFLICWLVAATLVGCGDDATVDVDGGGDRDASPTIDGGVDVDAGTLAWDAIDPPAAGPLGIWGFMAAPIDESRTVVVGGATFTSAGTAGTAIDETWLYEATADGLDATEVVTPDNTGPRYCGCAAWDPTRRRVVVIGGRDNVGMEYAPETWELDLDTPAWTRIAVPATPDSVVGCGLAHAPDRDAMYLFGGGSRVLGFSDRTYRYDPAVPEWVMLDATGPGARYDMAFTPLGAGKPIVMHGGSLGADGVAFFSDIWLFDPATETWSESLPTNGEGLPRRTPWLVRDPDGDGFLVGFGNTGLDPSNARSDLAHYDLATGEWTDVTPASGPGPHGFSQPLAGGAAGLAYLFGGYDNTRPLMEVWRLVRR